jgi:hypothetical protein
MLALTTTSLLVRDTQRVMRRREHTTAGPWLDRMLCCWLVCQLPGAVDNVSLPALVLVDLSRLSIVLPLLPGLWFQGRICVRP